MDTRTVNGLVWGRIMLGKAGNVPSYRKNINDKWIPVKASDVPQDVKEAFDTAVVKLDESVVISNAASIVTPDNDFGFIGTDTDTTEIPEIDVKDLHTCNLKELCDELYTRFGIYTCYLQREPNSKDIHPITGGMMNNFVLGQARQHYLTARRTGASWNLDVMKQTLTIREQPDFDFDAHYAAHPEHFERPAIEGEQHLSMKEYRELRKQSKPIMMTEHGRRGDGTDEDELYAEPPINGRIIRPYHTSPAATRRLEELRRARGEY